MKVGLTFNSIPEDYVRGESDRYAEFDDMSTINAIKGAIESGGHEVLLIEADENAYEKLKQSKLDIVFNIAEGLNGESRESQIPAMLDMLNIPYTGSNALTLGIALDKTRTKEILSYYKIPTAKFQLFKSPNDPLDKNLRFPLFVKPNTEGSSRGITGKSLVNNEKELRETAASIIKKYHQPALVEEFLDGREFTVSLIGNPSEIMPIVEITFDNLPEGVPKFDCYDVKWVWDSPDSEVETVICPAKIDKKLEDMIKRTALDTFQALECLDFGRIDMRLDRNGVPNVIDVNPIAGLIPDPKENSRFPKACYTAGMTYNQIILKIIESALKRIGK
ncbi:MAG: D-alanine--D-alanine ligase [Candidatus Aenigmarchaeota archaeon CG_4_10_14_0_8_um_filter_37_24]|nr:D-alanine--D-alanine ligase [Candidatus Aenigmarchaeota archaeon]OIN85407.1 MAG: hypothetical protein AUJ50_04960 [Candidatus Aenigmarchaeota archaeon CG1_02_38_14]PIV69585.1 MAG: D-alanine--D-alanine ligase [Candidatus Aenigmarchaeota archaeon CG01_land_8_20_14_3_00_37_9]PIW41691.1 MAG: D-alanine--D-alanine ligase [Candidatus Aenigmarchaeota archaeon CG15_BIG_FIL_POST_REV_8_21_14_020_37_27]PIX50335.1 MAG: D-alanine--D-alanine ligase [Candidatus Aenigmarchaeota archaeon CG_4_8_14_3_um_filter